MNICYQNFRFYIFILCVCLYVFPYLLHNIHEDQKTTWGVLLYHSSYESYGLNSVHLEEVGCQKIGLNDYGMALFLGGALKFIPVAIMLLSTSLFPSVWFASVSVSPCPNRLYCVKLWSSKNLHLLQVVSLRILVIVIRELTIAYYNENNLKIYHIIYAWEWVTKHVYIWILLHK